MKILVIGGNGMLGHKLVQTLSQRFEVYSTIRTSFENVARFGIFERVKTFENIDVQKFKSVKAVLLDLRPDVVINAVGVIKQKAEVQDVVKTLEINSVFPHKVAQITEKKGARFITFGTDCVFDGKTGGYTEESIPNATDLYGISKALGEVTGGNSLTLRTSIIGRELETSNSLVEWFLKNRDREVNGYNNAIFSGFPTIVLSRIVELIIADHKDLGGLFHLSSEPINKFHLLELIRAELDLKNPLRPFADYKIDRSLNSDKFRARTGFRAAPWPHMIKELFDDPTPYNEFRRSTKKKY